LNKESDDNSRINDLTNIIRDVKKKNSKKDRYYKLS